MCGIGDDSITTMPELSVLPKLSCESLCMKCGTAPAVTIARLKDPFCMECFDVYFAHRFRATFGKAKIVRQGEQVLVAFSGGESSRVLLKLIEDGLHKDAPKKLRFIPTLIHIDESVLLKPTVKSHYDVVLSITSQTQFPVVYTRLEEILGSCRFWYLSDILTAPSSRVTSQCNADEVLVDSSSSSFHDPSIIASSIQSYCPLDNSLGMELQSLFAAVKSRTSKEAMLCLIRKKLLRNIALKLGYSKVLVGDNASLLSCRLLANVAQGRGATLPMDTGFTDGHQDVMILRPLREFPSSEVDSFCKLKGLDTVNSSQLMFEDDMSIERITESFIKELQTGFPSTISTIFRTGDKLSLDAVSGSVVTHVCPLCQVPVGSPPDKDVFCHINMLEQTYAKQFWINLCYGCSLMIKDMELSQEMRTLLIKIGK